MKTEIPATFQPIEEPRLLGSDPCQADLELFEDAPTKPAGGPAHDIANLLGVIVAICESLEEDLREIPKQAELARIGLVAAERAAGLLNGLGEPIGRSPRGPMPEPRRPEVPARAEPSEAAASILVVDDDPRLLALMSSAFTRAGFRTFSARNGRVALQILKAAQPDLMVTDIVMPEMEGLAAIREAKRLSPGTRIVAISGGGQYERPGSFLTWAEGLGADEVMAKPFKMSSLLTAARLVLARGDVPPGAARTG